MPSPLSRRRRPAAGVPPCNFPFTSSSRPRWASPPTRPRPFCQSPGPSAGPNRLKINNGASPASRLPFLRRRVRASRQAGGELRGRAQGSRADSVDTLAPAHPVGSRGVLRKQERPRGPESRPSRSRAVTRSPPASLPAGRSAEDAGARPRARTHAPSPHAQPVRPGFACPGAGRAGRPGVSASFFG